MKRSVQILLLLFLFALPAGAQDVVLKGGGDLHRLCEDETLKPECGWRIVHKNMSVGGLSPEDWYGIVKVEQKGGGYEATLAFGPVKCDGFSWVNDQEVAQFWRGRKYSLLCKQENGKFVQTIKDFACKGFIRSGKKDGKNVTLVLDNDGFYSWVSEKGGHLDGTPVHYDNVLLFSKALPGEVLVKENGKWGVLQNSSEVVFPAQYDTLILTNNVRNWGGEWTKANWFFVKKDGRWGVRGDNLAEPLPVIYAGLSYWYSAPETWCYQMPGCKWGMMETSGKKLLPEEYDALTSFSFPQSVGGSYRLPMAIIAKKGGKMGLINHKGKDLLPFKFDSSQFDLLCMFYPENSFSVFTWNRYRIWEKGEYESNAEYEQRRADPTKITGYMASLLPAAEKAFINSKTGEGTEIILSRYDAETETFLFGHSHILQDTYRLEVPRMEAPLFKEEFESMKEAALKTATYFICNDMLTLRSISFTTPGGKTYTYENPAADGYAGPGIRDLDLMKK